MSAPDLARVRASREHGRCLFCRQPARGRSTCGSKECQRQYNRAWHRDAQRRAPEKYGRPFYVAKGLLPAPVSRTAQAPRRSLLELYPDKPRHLEPVPPPPAAPPRPATLPAPTWPATIGSCYLRPLEDVRELPAEDASPVPFDETLPPLSGRRPAHRAPTKSQRAIRLAQLREELTAEDVQAELQISQDAAHQLLRRLVLAGELVRLRPGVYVHPDSEDAP